jgi:hypothetical protein
MRQGEVMRTTLNLDESVLAELKRLAVETHRTVSAVAEDAIREALARRRERRNGTTVELPTFRGRGVRPGVDLDNDAALLDRMDELDGVFDQYRGLEGGTGEAET